MMELEMFECDPDAPAQGHLRREKSQEMNASRPKPLLYICANCHKTIPT